MKDFKWVKVRKKKEWSCDVCRTCGDPRCCTPPVKWLKHPNIALLGDVALCNLCFDNHKEKILGRAKNDRK